MQVVRKQEEHVRTHSTWSVGILDLWSSDFAMDFKSPCQISKTINHFQEQCCRLDQHFMWKINVQTQKIKQYETKHFNTVLPRKSRTRKLFVVAWYCIPVQALTRTHQTARNTEMHGVCYWCLRVGCLLYLFEILIIWKVNSCSIDFTQNMEK